MLVLLSHLRCFLKTHAEQRGSADTSSKLNNSPCFHLPIVLSANLKPFHTLCLLRQCSNKRCCQLTRWKNILLIFSSSPPQWGVLMCRDEGWITACLGEAWHKTGCRWHDEPRDCWQILVMSLPALDSSDTLAWGTGKTRNRRSCWCAGGGGGWEGKGAGGGLMRRNTGALTAQLFCFL